MTRKDYVAIAAAIKGEVDAASNAATIALERCARAIAAALAADNPRFDRERFLKACGF